ncbi:MAG TPA: phosphoenolpyruvate--protein phosphotransferase [Pontiella sp.]
MTEHRTTEKLCGKTLAPGLGEGNVFVYRDILKRFDEFYDIDLTEVQHEQERLDRALARIAEDLSALATRVEKEIDAELAEVFRAHYMMVQDPSLGKEVQKEIKEELVSAGSAVKTVFRRWERRFRSMEAEVAKQKGDDMRDLERRLISSLAGIHGHALEGIPHGSVLVANRLFPSDTVFLERNSAAAAVLEVGGKGSHAALFAREIGLPCVAGIKGLLDTVREGAFVIVDADKGEVTVDPTQKQRQAFHAEQDQRKSAIAQARNRAQKPAVTRRGEQIAVLANVGDAADTEFAIENGSDGVGLYRLEQIYLGRQTPPNITELLEEMQRTLYPARGLPVYVRLLDVGADKPLPFLDMPREANPSLGMRGIRFLLEHPDLLQTQLDALLKLSSEHDLHVLVPMVTLPSDVAAVREALKDATARIKTSNVPRLGAMIETPAAALGSAEIATSVDFLSFGTNDLTQYSFATDRENVAVDAYFDDTHDVIFRLISMVHDDVPDIPLSVCGELAGQSKVTSRLIASGITSLSVAPPSIPMIKESVRACDQASKPRVNKAIDGN